MQMNYKFIISFSNPWENPINIKTQTTQEYIEWNYKT